MIRKLTVRFVNGFCCSVAITLLVHAAILFATGSPQMLPEYAARFDSELKAYMVELLLIGLMSAATSAGTVVFDARRIGLVLQSVLFIGIMLAAWLPVACFVWGFHRYLGSMISTIISLVVTYGICMGLRYRSCRKEIDAINEKLRRRKES